MAYLLIGERFWNAPEVLLVGNRAIGLWVRLASYHARWSDYDIPRGLLKVCRSTKADLQALVEYEWLIETADGWRLGHVDTGLWKIGNSVTGSDRPSRPPIPPNVRSAVFERDGLACLWCDADEDLTLDHIIPWSHGGPDTVENLRVLCRSCNSKRGNRVEVVGG